MIPAMKRTIELTSLEIDALVNHLEGDDSPPMGAAVTRIVDRLKSAKDYGAGNIKAKPAGKLVVMAAMHRTADFLDVRLEQVKLLCMGRPEGFTQRLRALAEAQEGC